MRVGGGKGLHVGGFCVSTGAYHASTSTSIPPFLHLSPPPPHIKESSILLLEDTLCADAPGLARQTAVHKGTCARLWRHSLGVGWAFIDDASWVGPSPGVVALTGFAAQASHHLFNPGDVGTRDRQRCADYTIWTIMKVSRCSLNCPALAYRTIDKHA